TCSVSIVYKPAAMGTSSAVLTVSDDAAGSPHGAPLSGTGVLTPKVTLSATTLAFGNQFQSTATAAKSVTLSNTGNGALNITSITVTGTDAADFSQTTTCGASLPVGGSCTLSVVFT